MKTILRLAETDGEFGLTFKNWFLPFTETMVDSLIADLQKYKNEKFSPKSETTKSGKSE